MHQIVQMTVSSGRETVGDGHGQTGEQQHGRGIDGFELTATG